VLAIDHEAEASEANNHYGRVFETTAGLERNALSGRIDFTAEPCMVALNVFANQVK
jgi:hypothetical protein